MSARTRVAVVSALALSCGVLLDRVPSGARVEAQAATASVRISPDDASININSHNFSGHQRLMTYTWPDRRPANAIVLKFDLSALPAGAVVEDATLRLALVESDASAETIYTVTAHKIVGRNPVIGLVTGYTADGVTGWTPNSNCYNNVPLAQADISLPYDTRPVDKVRGDKIWNLTAMVREWLADPASNFGMLLNADKSVSRDRYRFFASMEHTNAALRPYLHVTYSLPVGDLLPPVVALKAPVAGAVLSGLSRLEAAATDNVGVTGVQFYVDGAPFGGEMAAAPYALDLDTAPLPDGVHTLTAVARDAAGNAGTAAAVAVTTANGTVRLRPDDTSLNLNNTNHGANQTLTTYTWPDNKVANAIVLKFDLSSLPAGAAIDEATLHLALLASDAAPEGTYTVTAHKIVGRNPVIAAATGYSADGVNGWTPNACCYNGAPLAQADISMAFDTRAVDKTPGFKTWIITSIVQDWVADPSSNFGVLLNSDATALRDRYRFFASMEHADAALRPYLQIRYSVPPADSTPPAISNVAPGDVTATSAVITWTTDEASDSQVDYGTTTAYGSTTPADASLVMSHRVGLSGLRESTQYHYRVRSRDDAGNAATSAGGTFRTLAPADTTPPAVSITAPAAGAAVSGAVAVAVSATDNVGVAGVQFLLDGGNLGAEDTTAPYSVSWNTAAAADGGHVLTAVARDAAGNQTVSAGVTVTVRNTVSSGGIAALYPGDVNIESDPDVMFVEKFEEASLAELFNRWTDNGNGSRMSFTTDVPAGSPGLKSLNIPTLGGVTNGGSLYKQLSTGVDDVLYVRYYIKYPTTGKYKHEGIWMGGHNPPLPYPNPQAGSKPVGNDRFSAAAEQSDDRTQFDHYNYWMGMHQSGDGKYWGNNLLNDPDVRVRTGQWVCVEQMVKLNNPTTAANGEHAIWVDGVKVSHLGLGFPRGFWSGGRFTQDPTGSPFEGFRWRSDANLKLNWIWLQNYSPDDPAGFSAEMKFDHVVVAKRYIGCLSAGGADTVRPTVSISAPANGATVTGSAVTVSATAADNVGVAGVQFKLDGVNVGAEDTTSPYSIVWDSQAAASGTHILTAVARDAAGNSATSASVSVAVANQSLQTTLIPLDTYIGLDAANYSTNATLATYTWPDNSVANAILMKFDLTRIPAGATVQAADLQLALVESDTSADSTYAVSAHKVVGIRPDVTKATGFTADGVAAWTANACCSNSVPLAQADISPAYDVRQIDKAPGYKSWSILAMLQEWLANPATNLGLVLNSDASRPRDRYRYFASTEHPDPGLRPFLRITYSSTPDVAPPAVSLSSPAAGATVGGAMTVEASATDDVGVAGVQFRVDGVNVGAEDTAAPYAVSWDTTAAANGSHTLTAVARDGAGNSTTSSGVTVTVSNVKGEALVAWVQNSEPDLAGYKVYVGESSGVYAKAIDVGRTTSYTVAGLEAGRRYYFVVTAYDSNGNESTPSEEVSAVVASPLAMNRDLRPVGHLHTGE